MENSKMENSVNEMVNADDHDLFRLLKTAECIKVSSVTPVKEELTPLELAVYNFLLNFSRDLPTNRERFTIDFLQNKLSTKYSTDDLVDAFRNLDKKYYTECAFDDKGQCAWVKLL